MFTARIRAHELGERLTGVGLEVGTVGGGEVGELLQLAKVAIVHLALLLVHQGVVGFVEDDAHLRARLAGDVGVAPLLELSVLALHLRRVRVEVELQEGVVIARDGSLEGLRQATVRSELEETLVIVVVAAGVGADDLGASARGGARAARRRGGASTVAVERSRRGRDVGRGGGARAGPAARTRRRAGGRQDAPIARRRRRGKHRRERPSAPCGTRTSHRARVRRVPFVTNQHARFPSATEFCWRAFSRHPPGNISSGGRPFESVTLGRVRHLDRLFSRLVNLPPSERACCDFSNHSTGKRSAYDVTRSRPRSPQCTSPPTPASSACALRSA